MYARVIGLFYDCPVPAHAVIDGRIQVLSSLSRNIMFDARDKPPGPTQLECADKIAFFFNELCLSQSSVLNAIMKAK